MRDKGVPADASGIPARTLETVRRKSRQLPWAVLPAASNEPRQTPEPRIRPGLDVFAGVRAPISAAPDQRGLARFEAFDLDANPQHNILDDAWFELLLRICWSGSVSLLTLAPPCKEYSRLKLRPGGPKALRAPSCMLGVPNLLLAELSRVRDSREIHRRGRELFKAVASQSGVAILEQPPSSMAWLEPENFQRLQNFHGHLAWVDACQHGMLLSKSWCFASNSACIQHMASRCTHQQKHASIAGVQRSSGQYLSTLTAECPASLKHCAFKVSTQPEVRRLSKPSPLSLRPVRLRVCDGAGMHSTADRSIPQPDHPLTVVAVKRTKTHPKNSGPRGSGNASPPLLEQQSEEAARIAFRAIAHPSLPITFACPGDGIQ